MISVTACASESWASAVAADNEADACTIFQVYVDYQFQKQTTTISGNSSYLAQQSSSILNYYGMINGTVAQIDYSYTTTMSCCDDFEWVDTVTIDYSGMYGCRNTRFVGFEQIIKSGDMGGVFDGNNPLFYMPGCLPRGGGPPSTLSAVFISTLSQVDLTSDQPAPAASTTMPQITSSSIPTAPVVGSSMPTQTRSSDQASSSQGIQSQRSESSAIQSSDSVIESTHPDPISTTPTKTSVVIGLSSQPLVIPASTSRTEDGSVSVSLEPSSTVPSIPTPNNSSHQNVIFTGVGVPTTSAEVAIEYPSTTGTDGTVSITLPLNPTGL